MPALNFQARFADAVERGEKRQTIRAYRKDGRDPKPGDTLYLYTGMRTKACRKLGEARCTVVVPVELRDEPGYPMVGDLCWEHPENRLAFAANDGFATWKSLVAWFEREHGLPFKGLLIRW